MSQPSENPYAPPQEADPGPAIPRQPSECLPLWIWLGIAVLVSFLGTPADPISVVVALANGLFFFWIGVAIGHRTNVFIRVTPVVLGAVVIPWWISQMDGGIMTLIWMGYAAVSVFFGAWTVQRIQLGRWQILVNFSLGYLVGSTFGLLGTIGGAVMGVNLAKKPLPIQPRNDDRPPTAVTG